MASINGDTLRGHLETLVLSALRRGDAHGFEILRRLTEAGSGALRLKEGSLYPALYRLEQAGLIAGAWEGDSAPPGRPPERAGPLTQAGVEPLAAARAGAAHGLRRVRDRPG